MPNWIINILGALYKYVPIEFRPICKKIFYWFLVRIQSVFLRRSVEKGKHVEFLGFEIAHLEPYEFLGPADGEIFVQACCSVVSPGTESAVLTGLPGARRMFPYVPGYSTSGKIVKIGKKNNGFEIGDRVTGRVSHASHQTVSSNVIFKIPEEVSYEEASFIELGIITLQGIRKSQIKPGDRVVVVGQGLIGQLCNRLLRLVGASEVIAMAASTRRKPIAMLPGGADSFISLNETDLDLSEIKADVVIEAVGSPNAVVTAAECAREGGKVVLLGSSRGLSRNIDLFKLIQKKGLSLVGAHISDMPENDASPLRWTYRQEGELFLELLQHKLLSVSELISWHAHPNECNAVYETLAEGGKNQVAVMFDWRLLNSSVP